MGFLLGLVIGLLVGWNLLPQPQWVVNLWEKFKAKVGG
jgi:hypothetical protein